MNRDEKAALAREQLRRFASQRALRRRVAKADYGIRLEWDVEWRGTTIASLSDPVSKDDNWISFRFSPTDARSGLARTNGNGAILDAPRFGLPEFRAEPRGNLRGCGGRGAIGRAHFSPTDAFRL